MRSSVQRGLLSCGQRRVTALPPSPLSLRFSAAIAVRARRAPASAALLQSLCASSCAAASASGAALPSARSSLRLLACAAAAASSLLLLSLHSSRAECASADAALPPHARLPSTATPSERQAVQSLRALLQTRLELGGEPELTAYMQRWALCNDMQLLRYLRAHRFALPAAADGVLATARWRMQHRIDALRARHLLPQLQQGNMFVSPGCDSQGRSLIVNRKSSAPSVGWSEEVFQREVDTLAYTMERAVRCMDDRLDCGQASPDTLDGKWLIWVDLQRYDSGSATPWAVTRALVDVMRLHYPERLSCGLIVDAPWVLRQLTNLLKPFIDRVTRDKILFVAQRAGAQTREQIANRFGREAIEALPSDSGIEGAKTVFDLKRYIAEDPLDKPRPSMRAGGPAAQTAASAQQAQASAAEPAASKGRSWAFWK